MGTLENDVGCCIFWREEFIAGAVEEIAYGSAAGGVGLAIALAPDDADDLAAGVEHATATVTRTDGAGNRRGWIGRADGGWMAGHAAFDAAKCAVGTETAGSKNSDRFFTARRKRLDAWSSNRESGQVVGAIVIDQSRGKLAAVGKGDDNLRLGRIEQMRAGKHQAD